MTIPNIPGIDKRAATRAPIGKPIKLQFDDSMEVVEGTCVNISIGGMFIQVDDKRPQGSLVRFELPLDDEESVRGLGEVVWMRAKAIGAGRDAGLGLKFRFLEKQDRKLIFTLVSQHIKERLDRRSQAAEESMAAQVASQTAPAAASHAPSVAAPEASPRVAQDRMPPAQAPSPARAPSSDQAPRPSSGQAPSSTQVPPSAQAPSSAQAPRPQPSSAQTPREQPSSAQVPQPSSAQTPQPSPAQIPQPSSAQRSQSQPAPASQPVEIPEAVPRMDLGIEPDHYAGPEPRRFPVVPAVVGGIMLLAIAVFMFRGQLFGGHEPDFIDPSVSDEPASVAPSTDPGAADPQTPGPQAVESQTVEPQTPGPGDPEAQTSQSQPSQSQPSQSQEASGAESAAETPAASVTPPPATAPPPPSRPATPPPRATRGYSKILSVTWRTTDTGLRVVFEGDGPIPESRYHHFRLNGDPPREVIQFKGVGEEFEETNLEVGGPGVERIRTGFHKKRSGNELHVVLDMVPGGRVTALQSLGFGLEVVVDVTED